MRKILMLISFFSCSVISAIPFDGQVMQFRQPDGSRVDVRLYGTEYYMKAEGLNGYTLVRDRQTGWICYARLSEDGGEFSSTGRVYTGTLGNISESEAPAGLAKHLDITEKAREHAILMNKTSLGLEPYMMSLTETNPHPVTGKIKGLCIVVDFPDEPASVPIAEFDNFCNDTVYTGYGNNGSLRKYYQDVSGKLVDYTNVVFGYFRAPLTFAAYEQMPYAQGAKIILGLALEWIDSLGFDFTTLSLNPDSSIMAINLMYTGEAQTWAQGMWWHSGYYGGFSSGGVHSGSYNCSPAYAPLKIATVAHENGHMIGKWPDTYKYNSNTGPDGIGAFDLMCSMGNSYNPVPPNPHYRSNASWGKVVDVTFYNGLIHDTANSLTCYKFCNLNDTNEFFLMESRRKTGRSTFIPDEGLTIWHIDRAGNNQTWHHEVYLEHANNNIQAHSNACFHLGFNDEFSLATTPSSNLYSGDPSGLRVWDIGPVGDIMTYKLGAGQAAPVFFLQFISITGDNNSNGYLEPGETADLNITASNFGQLSSGNALMSCAAIGANAPFVTVNNPAFNAGVIGVAQTIAVSFSITLSPAISLGSEIILQFTISDGAVSTYITKKIMLGEQILIGIPQVTNCQAMFFDHGGPYSGYLNNTDYTTSFFPASPSQFVSAQFLSFDLEDEANCIYDYLNIYNGPDNNAPLIGKYCGTNSPGTVVSTDPSGALTFEFHSDEGVVGEGWSAVISCSGNSGFHDMGDTDEIRVFPNPSGDHFSVYLPYPGATGISVRNMTGELIYSANTSGHEKLNINLSKVPAGVYMLQVTTGTLAVVKKLLLLK